MSFQQFQMLKKHVDRRGHKPYAKDAPTFVCPECGHKWLPRKRPKERVLPFIRCPKCMTALEIE